MKNTRETGSIDEWGLREWLIVAAGFALGCGFFDLLHRFFGIDPLR